MTCAHNLICLSFLRLAYFVVYQFGFYFTLENVDENDNRNKYYFLSFDIFGTYH